MTQKKYLLALEHNLPNDETSLSSALLGKVSQFIERNQIVERDLLKNKHPLHACCPQCLKAYLLTKAQEYNLSKKDAARLVKRIKGPIGHQGYYLDNGELQLIKIRD